MDYNVTKEYDASEVIPFLKGTDTYDGVELKLGNMIGGFPVTIGGCTFHTSEAAYISGFYSDNNDECVRIQKEISECKNGMGVKMSFRHNAKNTIHGRTDFDRENWRFDWMFYIVWNKVKQNKEFADILLSLPMEKNFVEDGNKTRTGSIWGCRNIELSEFLKRAKDTLGDEMTKKEMKEAMDKIRTENNSSIGKWVGRNIMGRILKQCQISLANGVEPSINYDALNDAEIYMAGKRLRF